MNGRRAGLLGLAAALAALLVLAVFLLRQGAGGGEDQAASLRQAEDAAPAPPELDVAAPKLLTDAKDEAGAATAEPASAAEPDNGKTRILTITGIVTDDTGRPQPGAQVLLVPDALTLAAQGRRRDGGTWLNGLTPADFTSTSTGADGRFTLTVPLARRGPIDARPWGEPEDPWLVARLAGFAPTGFPCRDILGAHFDAGTLKLEPGGRVAGRVTDEHGAPLAAARVACPVQDGWGRYLRPPDEIEALLYIGATDAAGRFEIGELPAMWLEGSASLPDRRPAGWPAFELTAGQMHELPDLVLRAGASVAGVVVGPDGKPRAGAQVLALNISAQQRNIAEQLEWDARTASAARGDPCTVSGPDGRFALHGLDGASRTLLARAPGCAFAVTHDVANEVTDLVLALREPAVLELHVVDRASGQPLAATVTASANVPPFASDPPPLTVQAVPDSPGRYRVIDAAGTGTSLVVSEAGHARTTASAPGLPPGQHSDFTVELDRGWTIHGRVVDEAGAPLASAEVTLLAFPENNAQRSRVLSALGYVGRDGEIHTAQPPTKPSQVVRPAQPCAATGEFSFDQLAPAGYALRAAAFGHVRAESELIEIGPDKPPADVVVTLRAAGDVRGALLNGDGTPGVSDIWMESAGNTNGPSTVTDNTGHFVLRDVPPGDWTVHATAAEPAPVTVVAGQSAEVVLQRPATCTLIVEVTAAGQPVGNASVMLQGEGMPLVGMRTDAAGQCQTQLPPKRWVVGVAAPSGGQASRTLDLLAGETRTLKIEMPLGRIVVEAHEAGTGGPATGVPLRCRRASGPDDPDTHGPWFDMEPVRTDANGRGLLEQLAPGTWSVYAGGDGWIAAAPVTVEVGEQPASVSVELRHAPVVRVLVSAADGTPAPAGTTVVLSRADRPALQPHSGETDKDGWFECRELEEAGAWLASVPAVWNFDPSAPPLAKGVVMAVEGQTTELRLTLPSPP